MQDINNIPDYNLIAKYLAGEADKKEIELIKNWLNEVNRNEFEKIKQIWVSTENQDYFYNTEKALSSVNKRIKQSTNLRKFKLFTLTAAAIILIIAIPSIIFKLQSDSIQNTIIIKSTQENLKSFQLADGSNITLNHNSKISYSDTFEKNRTVKLEGEAYFEVEHIDKQNKFVVQTKGIDITVVGTKFNVKAIEKSNIVEISVTEGIVLVKYPQINLESRISNGQKLVINIESKRYNLENTETTNDIFWITKTISFNNSSISEIASTISKVYGVDVELQLKNTDNISLNTRFENKSLDEVLRILELTLDIKTSRKNGVVVIEDAEI